MKTVIITEGGENIGFGHLMRCLALCQAFREKGVSCEMVIRGDASVKDCFKCVDNRIFNWRDERKKALEIVKSCDITVIDSYLADATFYQSVSDTAKTAVYIDDNKRIDYPKGIVVNGSILAERMEYPRKKGVLYLLGAEYLLLREEFRDLPKRRLKRCMENVMITFGGDDTRRITPDVLRLFIKHYPQLGKKVVIGRAFQDTAGIESLSAGDKKTELIYYPDASNIKKVMLESDAAVSAGGQTLYELAGTGVPAIAVVVADNQILNVRGGEKKGFLEFAGRYNDKNLFKNIEVCFKGLNYEKRVQMSRAGQAIIDGKSPARLAGRILAYAGKNA